VRSPLEAIDGAFEHAVFTTYSLNLHFFEHWVLPLLRKAEVRNTIIFADRDQLAVALADRTLRSLGRSYHVVSTKIGPGAFHPKLMFLSGEDATRVCVSSANLTIDGQLRNLEAGVVLDSTVDAHRQAIADANGFLRRLSRDAPPHTADALLAALPEEGSTTSHAPIRIVHNLEAPLIEHLPNNGGVVAVAPYTDTGEAARRLSERRPLELITDARTFAAPARFFSGTWTVAPREFGDRRLHGKVYWRREPSSDGWLLLGSPNLSEPALLRSAENGNTEIAVLFSPSPRATLDPGGDPWDGEAIETLATRRHLRNAAAPATPTVGSFNAWEDEDLIRLEGIPDGSLVDQWDGDRWVPLGPVTAGVIHPPADVRPYLIRVTLPGRAITQAVVHRTNQLVHHRTRPRVTSRAADVVSQLPIDLPGVRALEGVLVDLYTLDQLATEASPKTGPQPATTTTDPLEALTDWLPAKGDDEPRVGDLYRRSWGNSPDALLALIRHALRLDRPVGANEADIGDERIGIEQLDEEFEAHLPEPTATVAVPRNVLKRYRTALLSLLNRGSAFIRGARRQVLADLAFQAVLRLHEQIGRLEVTVDDEDVHLIEPDVLLREKLDLLRAYLADRGGSDPACLATARIHLADCVARREFWTPLEWESLEALAYRSAARIVASREHVAEAAEDACVDLDEATARLQPYADRTDWIGYIDEAENHLYDIDFDEAPLIWVAGKGTFREIDASPAWAVIGYGAIAGFQTQSPYAVIVRNTSTRGPHSDHAIAVDPARGVLFEAARRRTDGCWLARQYHPVREHQLDTAGRLGPQVLLDTCARSPFRETGVGGLTPSLLRDLLMLSAGTLQR
jgi:hypothetical protein